MLQELGHQGDRTAAVPRDAREERGQPVRPDHAAIVHLRLVDRPRAHSEDPGRSFDRVMAGRGRDEREVLGRALLPCGRRHLAPRGRERRQVGERPAMGEDARAMAPVLRVVPGQRLRPPAGLFEQPVDHEELDGRGRRPHLVDRHRVVREAVDQRREGSRGMRNGHLVAEVRRVIEACGRLEIPFEKLPEIRPAHSARPDALRQAELREELPHRRLPDHRTASGGRFMRVPVERLDDDLRVGCERHASRSFQRTTPPSTRACRAD